MSGPTRHCSKSGCAEPASMTLTYEYATSHAWLDDLVAERDPHAYDLCRRHASTLSVPLGWRRTVRSGHDSTALTLSA